LTVVRRQAWIVVAIGVLVGAVSAPAYAQPTGKVHRIGVLDVVDEAANAANLAAFREALRGLGHVEGPSFVLEYRSADGRPERLRDLATELVRLPVDVILTRGTPAALSAKQATRTIPIVMASSGEPVIEGIVASLDRPGGNVTGLYAMPPVALGGQRLQLLKEAIPRSSRVGILWNTADLLPPLIMRDTERVARAMGLSLKSLEVHGPRGDDMFGPAFEAALMAQVDALIVVEDPFTVADRARIVDFAAMSRLPAMYGLREFVDAGGLMSYGTDRRDLFRRSATYVHRILQGARPADLPVEPPRKFELAINLKTAKGLGLTIPLPVLRRADYTIPE
jgi:ABC-type uncharacterized transport system substrate-binding protein